MKRCLLGALLLVLGLTVPAVVQGYREPNVIFEELRFSGLTDVRGYTYNPERESQMTFSGLSTVVVEFNTRWYECYYRRSAAVLQISRNGVYWSDAASARLTHYPGFSWPAFVFVWDASSYPPGEYQLRVFARNGRQALWYDRNDNGAIDGEEKVPSVTVRIQPAPG